MPTNLSTLLAPINESSPCGEDLLFSADFDAIQHARRFEDPSLDQGEWVTDIKEADWPFVVERCSSLLQTQTKDLRLAVWLTEALAIEEGVTGLTQGYALLTGLSERYWDHVHPLPEGDDTEYRLGNVAWLVGRTGELLRAMPLTSSQGNSYSTIDWDVATHVAQAVKRDPDHADDIARGKPSIELIEASKRATPPAFYAALLVDLKAFEAAMLALEQELDRRAADSAPSFRQAKDAYDSVYRLAERFARELGVSAEAAPPKAPKPEEHERAEPTFKTSLQREEPVSATMPSSPIAGIHSRAQAVAQLRAVARFFRSTEPHNPAAYLADKAAECADMPLHQWLSSVVKDDGSLAHIRELLGVKPDEKN
ncbi:type VI secretion system protein TssA [Paraburkholderia lacunae]|uniref:Type VI secretion system protein TssA n=1 Tax=Paraburkholderia lacunae TaxID=2211104 RepID=A0A370N303_9BURK|nr:type VI secretion system protein TssA [Paraburkholderia lacunae]RDJ99904.1 type VI secretion system protein TssA [Paraburkholderia lacunae]